MFLGLAEGAFITVGADEGVGEEDVAGDAEAMTAERAFGAAIALGA